MPQRRNGRLKKRLEIGEYLARDPEIYHGELTFEGTRVPVSAVLVYVAKGISVEDMPRHWPEVLPDAARETIRLGGQAMLEKYKKAA